MSDRFTPEQMIQVRQLYGLSSVVGAAHDLDPFSPDQEKVARICAAFGILDWCNSARHLARGRR